MDVLSGLWTGYLSRGTTGLGNLVSVFSGRDSANMACNIRLVTGVDYLYLNVGLQMAILRWYRTLCCIFFWILRNV